MTTAEFDAERAVLSEKAIFEPLVINDKNGKTRPLSKSGLPQEAQIIIAERNGQQITFLLRHLSYHHLAQGELAGQPYMVSF
ncbi:MAG: hypothetical protein AAF633_03215 [Chloroflexota bacterium]